MIQIKFPALLLLFCLSTLSAAITLKDVKPKIDEILSYHVDQEKIDDLVLTRSFKTLILRFDPDKMILLRSDVEPYRNFSSAKLSTFVKQYGDGDFTIFLKMHKSFIGAVHRGRKIRARVKAELIKENAQREGEEESPIFPSDFASTAEELYRRHYSAMQRSLSRYASDQNKSTLDREESLKVLNFYEKKFRQHEDQFLSKYNNYQGKAPLNILKALCSSFDAHTMFYSKEEADEIRALLKKQICGVGIGLKEGVDGPVVQSLLAGGPAFRAEKISVGDVLREIDGKSVSDLYFKDVLALMGGASNTSSLFTFSRSDGSELSVSLVREKIVLENDRIQVDFEKFADGVIGKVTLSSFYDNGEGISVESDLKEAIAELRAVGPIYGLIIDMRKNAGGFLNQAVKVGGLFIQNKVVVIAKYAKGEIQYARNLDPRQFYDGPLVLLTSKASASAAEIVAQALKDEGAAIVVGDERTYGKGSMQYQTITDKSAKNFYKVTIGRYYTVAGTSTQLKGVRADIVVPSQFNERLIGERFLLYPLPNIPLVEKQDIEEELQKIFASVEKRPLSRWQKMVPILEKNSCIRIDQNKNFQLFLSSDRLKRGYGVSDLQMDEAVNVVKDMIQLSK